MAYKNSDYTIVIAVVRWPKRIILVLKLTLMLKLWVFLSSCWLPLSKHLLQLLLDSGMANKDSDYTAMNAVMYW